MTYVLIDRRQNDGKKSLPNRTRYLRRVREQIRESVKKQITDGSIADSMSQKDRKVKIKRGGLHQPEFHYAAGSGVTDHVNSHNDRYRVGDRIPKPQPEKKNGNGAGSGGGSSQDAFEFTITRDEFMDIFFEDLELPNLAKRTIQDTPEWKNERAGFSVSGPPARLNVFRTMRHAKGRRIALITPKSRRIAEIEELLKSLNLTEEEHNTFLAELEDLRKKVRSIPFIDDKDLRYNYWEKKPKPSTKAVVFSILDVSGSMNQKMKELAKSFFILALLFLQRKYERVDIVWIRHTDTAHEVTEEDFFHSRETGGTVVSSALTLMNKIQEERYSPNEWNIYGVQMSDGDNLHLDNELTHHLMREKILPACQYFAYVEVRDDMLDGATLAGIMKAYHKTVGSDLYTIYKGLSEEFPHFAVNVISSERQIYPVFRKLFKKRINGK